MRVSSKRFLCAFLALVADIFLVFLTPNTYIAVLLGVFVFLFVWYVAEVQDNTYIVLFLIAYFTFLLGRPIVKEFFHNDSAYYSVAISQNTDNYTYSVLTVSLLSIALGYALAKFTHTDMSRSQTTKNIAIDAE